jgi:hypothetical protein
MELIDLDIAFTFSSLESTLTQFFQLSFPPVHTRAGTRNHVTNFARHIRVGLVDAGHGGCRETQQ